MKKGSKIWFVRFLGVFALCVAALSFGTVNASAATHTHSYTSSVTRQATCTATGVRTYKCTRCTYSYTSTIAKLGHSYSWVTTKQPTCGAGGKSEYKCSRCGHVSNGQDIPSTGRHNWTVTSTKAATCTADGSKSYRCSTCGATKTEKNGTKLGHSYSWVTTKQPTCGAGGKSEYKCSRCGHVSNGQDIPSTGKHTWKETASSPATCTADGSKSYKCSTCGATKTEKNGTKLGHSYSWVTTKQPTCGAGGKSEYKCSRCGHVSNGQDIPATGKHAWKETSSKPATCTTDGSKSYKCTNTGCTATKTEKNGTKLGHSYEWKTVVQPTCCKGGKAEYTCKNCGHVSNGQNIPYTGKHTWGTKPIETKAATCGTDGYKIYQCVNGSTTKKEIIPATGKHDTEIVITPPTCYAEGKKEQVCKVCKKVLNGENIQPIPHSIGVRNVVASTCTKEGSQERYCKNSGCTYSYKETLPKKDHDYKFYKRVTEATCTQAGDDYYLCSMCKSAGYHKTIPQKGHVLDSTTPTLVTNQPAGSGSHKAEPYHLRHCSACNQWVKQNHSLTELCHLEGTDSDAYICVDENGKHCGVWTLEHDCKYTDTKVYHRIMPQKNGNAEYQQKVVETCSVCHTERTYLYAVKTSKVSDSTFQGSSFAKVIFNTFKDLIIDDIKGLVGDKFVLFKIGDNLHTLIVNSYDYMSNVGVDAKNLPFHQITDPGQLEMVGFIIGCNDTFNVSWDYTNAKTTVNIDGSTVSGVDVFYKAYYCY